MTYNLIMFKLFSFTYWLLLLLIIPVYYLGYSLRNKDNLIYKLSLILFILEIFKQVYLLINNMWSVWYIPFQLCSIPMYYWLFKNTKLNNYYLTFLSSYTLISGIVALAYPMDMISHGLILCIHSYLWHYVIILMSSLAYFNNCKLDNKSFIKSIYLFIGMIIIATILNIVFNSFGEINMFYINCLRGAIQPIVKDLANITNIYFANTLYLIVIIFISYLINILLKVLRHNKNATK